MEFPQMGSGPNRQQIIDALRNTAQSASNNIAETASMPVDALAWALRKMGVPVGDKPVMGSDWMREKGLTAPTQEGASKVVGDTIGMISPMGFTKQGAQALIEGAGKLKNLPVGMSIKDVGTDEQMYRGVTQPWDEAARGDIEFWAPNIQHAAKYGVGGEMVSTQANTAKFAPLKESEYTAEKLNSLYSRSELDGVKVLDDAGNTVLFASFNKPKVTRTAVK
jgi:hypothetical protein